MPGVLHDRDRGNTKDDKKQALAEINLCNSVIVPNAALVLAFLFCSQFIPSWLMVPPF